MSHLAYKRIHIAHLVSYSQDGNGVCVWIFFLVLRAEYTFSHTQFSSCIRFFGVGERITKKNCVACMAHCDHNNPVTTKRKEKRKVKKNTVLNTINNWNNFIQNCVVFLLNLQMCVCDERQRSFFFGEIKFYSCFFFLLFCVSFPASSLPLCAKTLLSLSFSKERKVYQPVTYSINCKHKIAAMAITTLSRAFLYLCLRVHEWKHIARFPSG